MNADPTRAFEALAHFTRLAVVRLLVPAGPDGMTAGEIAKRLGVRPNALSFHLGRLAHAGLVNMRRDGRNQYYAIDYRRLLALVDFLVDDCCAGAPDGCMPGCPGTRRAASDTAAHENGREPAKNGDGAGRADR